MVRLYVLLFFSGLSSYETHMSRPFVLISDPTAHI
jgi:hypothetical protein